MPVTIEGDGTILGSTLTPVGSVISFAGSSAPADWLMCDGSAVSRTTYSGLFAVIGTTYGVGDGSTTFNLPNLKGRVVVGVDGADTAFDAVGETGGSKTSTAPHTHAIDHDHPSQNFTSGTESADHSHSGSTGFVSADHAHWTYSQDAGTASGGALRKGYANPGNGTSGIHANHTHSFSTGGRSAAHTHTTAVNLAALTGTSGASSAEATDGNLQPYIAMNYIIKA